MDSDRPGLLATYRQALQSRHYARRTVQTYERWIRRFLRFHRMRHPREMGGPDQCHSDPSGRHRKGERLHAEPRPRSLVVLYRRLLEVGPGDLDVVVRARRPKGLPAVLSVVEVRAVMQQLEGP
jgi:hypothetical protein